MFATTSTWLIILTFAPVLSIIAGAAVVATNHALNGVKTG